MKEFVSAETNGKISKIGLCLHFVLGSRISSGVKLS